MKKKYFLFVFAFFAIQFVMGQDYSRIVTQDSTVSLKPASIKRVRSGERRWGDGGAGIGLDYGGLIGVKATFYPVSYMGVFAAAGWEIINIGWNAGILGRFLPANGTHSVRPYLKVMYGVNGATKVSGKSSYDKMFYGITAGIGLEIRLGREKRGGLNLDLNVPFRSPEYFLQVDKMMNDPGVTMSSKPMPIAFSLGYNVEF